MLAIPAAAAQEIAPPYTIDEIRSAGIPEARANGLFWIQEQGDDHVERFDYTIALVGGRLIPTWAGKRAAMRGVNPAEALAGSGLRLALAPYAKADDPPAACSPVQVGNTTNCAGTCPMLNVLVICPNGRILSVSVPGWCTSGAGQDGADECQCQYGFEAALNTDKCVGTAWWDLPGNSFQLHRMLSSPR